MPEQVTVIITETTPGGGSRFYQEPGRPSSVDVDSLTPNTEYRADAEYEAPDGTTIQASNSMTFRTLPVGMFSISNPGWKNDNDGQHSTFTFDYTSTYALSYAQVVDTVTGVTYQGTIVGSSVTAQLPAGTAGTQHTFQITIADIYGYSYVQGYVMTLQASMAETPFYIEAENPSDAPQISLVKVGSPTSLTMQTSYDKSTWTNYTIGDSIELSEEHPRIYFKNSRNTRFSTGSSRYYKFTADDYVNVGGNIASLKDSSMSDNTSNSYDFCRLFYQNAYLRNANKLYLGNYTTIAQGCYYYMFQDCTSLTQAPALPATTLNNYCYSYMFLGCTSLTQAPALPATTLNNYCYAYMFSGCTSLTIAPELPATTLTNYCYQYMFNGCSSLISPPALPATTLSEGCYYSMFAYCSSITSIPADLLPATTLASICYKNMFAYCSSITTIPTRFLPATTLSEGCYDLMFSGCTSLTSIPVDLLPATTLANKCYLAMFQNTNISESPILPASQAVTECYANMFNKCTNLRKITCLLTNMGPYGTNATQYWVSNVSSGGTFYKSPNISWTTGISGIPSGWTVVDYQN